LNSDVHKNSVHDAGSPSCEACCLRK